MNGYFFAYEIATGEERWKGKGSVSSQSLPAGFGVVPVSEAEFAGELADVPLSSIQAGISAQVNAWRDKVLQGGFHVSGGTLDGEILQLRDNDDKINWLTSKDMYRDQIAAGNGSVAGAPLRTLGNTTFNLTFDEGFAVLSGMALWGASVWQLSWDLKDAIEGAATALDALQIDYTAGW